MKNLQQHLNEALHDPFFISGKVCEYLVERRDKDEVDEVITNIISGIERALKKRHVQLSSEEEANSYLEAVVDSLNDIRKKHGYK